MPFRSGSLLGLTPALRCVGLPAAPMPVVAELFRRTTTHGTNLPRLRKLFPRLEPRSTMSDLVVARERRGGVLDEGRSYDSYAPRMPQLPAHRHAIRTLALFASCCASLFDHSKARTGGGGHGFSPRLGLVWSTRNPLCKAFQRISGRRGNGFPTCVGTGKLGKVCFLQRSPEWAYDLGSATEL